MDGLIELAKAVTAVANLTAGGESLTAFALTLILFAASVWTLRQPMVKLGIKVDALGDKLEALTHRVTGLEATQDAAEHAAQRERDAAVLTAAVRNAIRVELRRGAEE